MGTPWWHWSENTKYRKIRAFSSQKIDGHQSASPNDDMYPGVGTHWLAYFTKLEGISAGGIQSSQQFWFRNSIIIIMILGIKISNLRRFFKGFCKNRGRNLMTKLNFIDYTSLLCICPWPNTPRSPPFLALPQSLSEEASFAKVASPDSILAL